MKTTLCCTLQILLQREWSDLKARYDKAQEESEKEIEHLKEKLAEREVNVLLQCLYIINVSTSPYLTHMQYVQFMS